MNLQHFTIPVCPVCDAKEKVVADPESMRWHCFNCRSNGSVEAHADTAGTATAEADS